MQTPPEPSPWTEELDRLRRDLQRTARSVQRVSVLPSLAVEAVADFETRLQRFAVRWMEDLDEPTRRLFASMLDQCEALRAEVDRLADEVVRERE